MRPDLPGEEVTVAFETNSAAATADGNGDWSVVLPAMQADGKSHVMTITGRNMSLSMFMIRKPKQNGCNAISG